MSKAKATATTAISSTLASAANVPSVAEQDATLTAIASAAPEAPKVEDDDNSLVTVILSNAHKTPTAVILRKGASDSVDGKERWFAKKDLSAFQLKDGKWHVTAKRRYFIGKLTAYTEATAD